MSERCLADFAEVTMDCELPAGHEGDHEATLTWPQSEPHLASDEPLSEAMRLFLENKYGRVVSYG